MVKNSIIEVNNLSKYFPPSSNLLGQKTAGDLKAVDGVTFSIHAGESLGLVGESGCGKTTLGRCILQLYRATSGEVLFNGIDLCQLSNEELRPLRKRLQIIFQDPYDSLNPRFTASDIVGEPLRIHGITKNYRERVTELLEIVGLSSSMAGRYPHEFSGGQRQRLGIARALALQPDFIVCDEPISALDVSIQAQIINLLDDLQEQFNITYLFISHDLSAIRHISHRVIVMYLGKILEIAGRDELYEQPLHPYTQALLSAVPIPDPAIEKNRTIILLEGEASGSMSSPSGCVFYPRCRCALESCSSIVPILNDVGNSHEVACLLYESSWPH